jgi:hypothetical protein
MKDRDPQDPALTGDALPGDEDRSGLEYEPLEDEAGGARRLAMPRRADLAGSDQARRSDRVRPRAFRGSAGRGSAGKPPAPEASVPEIDAEAESREGPVSPLAEYLRTRGIRGRGPVQAAPARTGKGTRGGSQARKIAESRAEGSGPRLSRLSAPHPLSRLRRSEASSAPGLVRSPVRWTGKLAGLGTRPSRTSLRRSLHRPSVRAAFGFTGIVAVVAIVWALVAALPNQPGTAPATGSIYGINWRSASLPADVKFDFGPYFTEMGDQLIMLGTAGSTTTAWSTSDGTSWSRISGDGSFGMDGRRFVAQGMSDDGSGGLVAVGNSLPTGAGAGATDITATAWHSRDGKTWTRAQVDAASGQEMIGGAVSMGGTVVAGGNGVAWVSSDGTSWSPVAVPGAQGFIPRAVGSWGGGFAIVALWSGTGPTRSAVWYSPTGREWTQAATPLDGFDARGIASVGGRIVTVGSDSSDIAEGFAVSWTSTDGNTWVKATAPADRASTAMDSVAAVNGSFVAIGSPDLTATDAVSQSPATLAVWVSEDGVNWLPMSTTTPPITRGRLAIIRGQVLAVGGSGTGSGLGLLLGTPTMGVARAPIATASPPAVYALSLKAGSVPMIPDVNSKDALGPVVTTSDRFVTFITRPTGTTIWSSPDGSLWAQEVDPTGLTAAGNKGRPVILQAIQDGQGGIIAIGSVTDANGSTGTIWHRTSGTDWHQVTIQDDAPPEFSSIAAGPSGFVASSDQAGGSPVMYSTDGETWYASSISVADGFALTVNTYQYGFVAVGTNSAKGGLSAAWTSPDGRTWTLRTDWKLPANVSELFGLGKGLVATSSVSEAPIPTPAPSVSAGSSSPATPKATPTPKPTPKPSTAPPKTQWWWSSTGAAWQATSLETSTDNWAVVNDEIFALDPPATGSGDWTTWNSADGRTWNKSVSDPIAFPGSTVCAIASVGNKVVIVGWQAAGQLKGYFGQLKTS